MKPFLLISLVLLTSFSYAQKKRNVYFLRNDGKHVTTRDSADYIRTVEEPDSGSALFNVFEYYKDDKRKLIGKSSTIDPLTFEEQCIVFYPNGKKQSIINYNHGLKTGEEYDFYPNGKTYRLINFNNENKYDAYPKNYIIIENYDSLGTALVVNGNGIYKGFNENFNNIIEEGKVKNGLKDSLWHGTATWKHINYKVSDNNEVTQGKSITNIIRYIECYKNGILLTGVARDSTEKVYNYTKFRETMPEFRGGIAEFYRYLTNAIRYPDIDKKNNIQGRVIVTFVVNIDGKIENVRILRGLSETINYVAIEIVKGSPRWIPGKQYGIPVTVQYTVPIIFSLDRRY